MAQAIRGGHQTNVPTQHEKGQPDQQFVGDALGIEFHSNEFYRLGDFGKCIQNNVSDILFCDHLRGSCNKGLDLKITVK